MTPRAAVRPAPLAGTSSSDLAAPLYVAWQITNECNLACLHCIEESGPGKAFRDELDRGEALGVLGQLAQAEVPYISFSGGEPMVNPHFWDMVSFATGKGIGLKIETNGHYLDPEACRRLKELSVKAVQVSLDGAGSASFDKLRVHGRFEKAVEGIRNLRRAGVPIEINFSPTKFNCAEAGAVVDLAFELGAYSFYTGKTMFTGNAVRTWHLINPSEEQYGEFFRTLKAKAVEYEGRMRVYYHEMGILEELKYRLENPAALFIILPNGRVKLINALPFVCGDLRRKPLLSVWASFLKAWEHPKVKGFVAELERDPKLLAGLHDWIEVG